MQRDSWTPPGYSFWQRITRADDLDCSHLLLPQISKALLHIGASARQGWCASPSAGPARRIERRTPSARAARRASCPARKTSRSRSTWTSRPVTSRRSRRRPARSCRRGTAPSVSIFRGRRSGPAQRRSRAYGVAPGRHRAGRRAAGAVRAREDGAAFFTRRGAAEVVGDGARE